MQVVVLTDFEYLLIIFIVVSNTTVANFTSSVLFSPKLLLVFLIFL